MAELTPQQKHAGELHQVLSDLTSMARLGVPISCVQTYLAAIRNAEELLKQIERECTERQLLEQIERESMEE